MIHQLPLFSAPEPPRPRSPIARLTDPETSHKAAEEITASGTRDEQAEMVLNMVRSRPGLTSRELAEQFNVSRYIPGRRLSELRDLGLVHEGNPRRCRISGKRALTWYPNGDDR